MDHLRCDISSKTHQKDYSSPCFFSLSFVFTDPPSHSDLSTRGTFLEKTSEINLDAGHKIKRRVTFIRPAIRQPKVNNNMSFTPSNFIRKQSILLFA